MKQHLLNICFHYRIRIAQVAMDIKSWICSMSVLYRRSVYVAISQCMQYQFRNFLIKRLNIITLIGSKSSLRGWALKKIAIFTTFRLSPRFWRETELLTKKLTLNYRKKGSIPKVCLYANFFIRLVSYLSNILKKLNNSTHLFRNKTMSDAKKTGCLYIFFYSFKVSEDKR